MLLIVFVLSFTLIIGCQKAKEKTTEVKNIAADTAETVTDQVSETTEVIKRTAVEAKENTVGKLTEEKDRASAIITKDAALEKEVKAVVSIPEKVVSKSGPQERAGGKYVGAKKCKACHLKQFKSWSKTNMYTSFESLKPGQKAEAKTKAGFDPDKDYTNDAECLRCHTTGYGKGGFVSIETTPKLAGVQCEGCHGPGSEYSTIMRKNKQFKLEDVKKAGLIIPSENEEGCMECHGGDSPFNETLDPKYKFEFKERLEKTHEHFPLKYQH